MIWRISARQVGSGAERWVADYIEVGESRQAERITQSAARNFFDVHENFRVAGQFVSGEERGHVRSGSLGFATKAIGPVVGRRKRRVCLEDDIVLPGDPVA
ncbi:MAG: hypothetical protein H0X25_02750 [Acidobacteriales bacterium]|nr:hypothetical protein [Terriglobales bacterium]